MSGEGFFFKIVCHLMQEIRKNHLPIGTKDRSWISEWCGSMVVVSYHNEMTKCAMSAISGTHDGFSMFFSLSTERRQIHFCYHG